MSTKVLGKRTMANCNVDLPQDKICKYSYVSWCPSCDHDAPRRRTRSESYEMSCRRRCTPKKFDQRCEYENLDGVNCCEVREFRMERGGVRENLCELPTSYIANNCQINLTHAKLSVSSDYLESKIGSRDYENSYAVVSNDCSSPPAFFETMSERGAPKKQQQSPSSRATQRRTATSPTASARSPLMASERVLEGRTTSPSYDTSTFFDKHFDPKLVRQRYSRELEILREKLRDLHNHKYSPLKAPTTVMKNFDKCCERKRSSATDGFVEELGHEVPKLMQQNEKAGDAAGRIRPSTASVKRVVTKKEVNKSATKITVKTRSRVLATRSSKIKLRSVKNSTNTKKTVGEPAESDKSDNEEKIESADKEIPEDWKSKNIIEIHAPKIKYTVPKSCGDAPLWPIRYSMFPHIPPYIKFSMHDDEPNNLPSGRRYLKWKLSTITPIVVRKTLVNTGFRLVRMPDEPELEPKSNDWTGTWGKHMKSPMFKTLKNTQKLNHFAGTFQLGRKDRLWKNVQRLMHRFGAKEFGIIPQTFVLPQDLKALKQSWECKDGSAGEKWIVKPPASARGVGIKVINKWSQLPKQTSLVVQKYVSDPYLINGSKFDLRLYVLVTSFNPLRVYLYPEGLVRFASVKYTDDDKDLKDRFMHLTNYSINKLSNQYTVNEDANSCQGHKWTLTKLWEYLDDRGVDTKALWLNLKQLVIKTMISGESPISQLCNENLNSRYNCYELFGVDVLFDERLKPWLLEVNISPSLHSTSPLDLHVKGPLVQTLFNLAQFHLPPKVSKCESSPIAYDPRQYAIALTAKEANKHNYFMLMEKRTEYLHEILEHLTGDDVRHLTQAEDELVVKGTFERIFPTATTHKYLEFLPVRYYNRLFDAWETRYEKNRADGIQRLKQLCMRKVHLKIAQPPPSVKNSQNTIPATTSTTILASAVEQQQEPPSPQEKKELEQEPPHQHQHLHHQPAAAVTVVAKKPSLPTAKNVQD